jgi:hypothetical protein
MVRRPMPRRLADVWSMWSCHGHRRVTPGDVSGCNSRFSLPPPSPSRNFSPHLAIVLHGYTIPLIWIYLTRVPDPFPAYNMSMATFNIRKEGASDQRL